VLPLAVLALGCVGRDQDQSDHAARNGGQQSANALPVNVLLRVLGPSQRLRMIRRRCVHPKRKVDGRAAG